MIKVAIDRGVLINDAQFKIFDNLGYEIEFVSSGKDIISKLAVGYFYDVIIVKICMSDMSAYQLATKVKNYQKKSLQQKILVLTEKILPYEMALEYLNVGMFCIAKLPDSEDEFISSLEDFEYF